MITKEQAHEIAKKYLADKKRKFTSIDPVDKVMFTAQDELTYGDKQDQKFDTYTVPYGVMWGLEEKTHYIILSAETGEIFYTITPHWYEEEDE